MNEWEGQRFSLCSEGVFQYERKGNVRMNNGLRFLGDVPILIDGSNVVRHDTRYGWRVLKTLLDWLCNNRIKWFLYFDANILYVKDIDDAGKEFIKAQIADHYHTLLCPGGVQADVYIIAHADAYGNHIISNDRYRQYVERFPWIAEKQESGKHIVHEFAVEVDKLCVPDLGVRTRIDESGTDVGDMSKIEACRKAAERGDAEAQYRLGLCYFVGKDLVRNWDAKEGMMWLGKAAGQDHVGAQYLLGLCYGCGWGVVEDLAEAAKWYSKAAENGDVAAQCALGDCYYKGDGVVTDKTEAVKWYNKAAEQGDAKAQRKLGLCYSKGEGVMQNLEEAEKWWRKMIEQGDGCAKLNLGRYCNAADQGDAMAQYQLGKFYDGGEVVADKPFRQTADNLWLAAKWFHRAAEQGNAEAQYELGELYNDGFNLIGGTVNENEAVKWYRKAAEQGHAESQYKLGECYRYGWGLEKDEVEAMKWYRKAAEQGHEESAHEVLRDATGK